MNNRQRAIENLLILNGIQRKRYYCREDEEEGHKDKTRWLLGTSKNYHVHAIKLRATHALTTCSRS